MYDLQEWIEEARNINTDGLSGGMHARDHIGATKFGAVKAIQDLAADVDAKERHNGFLSGVVDGQATRIEALLRDVADLGELLSTAKAEDADPFERALRKIIGMTNEEIARWREENTETIHTHYGKLIVIRHGLLTDA